MQALPLFPLHTVLFPGARLPLRIFETRYIDLVRRCLRSDQPFGICLIQSGREVGPGATCVSTGTSARIVDWEQLDNGLLGIVVEGESRFRVHARTAAEDNLLMADIEMLAEDACTDVGPFNELRALLARILGEYQLPYSAQAGRVQEAGWLSYRLAELLALPAPVKQELLEIDSNEQRLLKIRSLLQGDGAMQACG